tara:strand:+ start:49 stop:330 length:282 start_codon:yes stop_codon:yes gene_type:complete
MELKTKYRIKTDLGYPLVPIVEMIMIVENKDEKNTELSIAYKSNKLVYLQIRAYKPATLKTATCERVKKGSHFTKRTKNSSGIKKSNLIRNDT